MPAADRNALLSHTSKAADQCHRCSEWADQHSCGKGTKHENRQPISGIGRSPIQRRRHTAACSPPPKGRPPLSPIETDRPSRFHTRIRGTSVNAIVCRRGKSGLGGTHKSPPGRQTGILYAAGYDILPRQPPLTARGR